MKITIIGCGAMGGLFAGRLASAGHTLTALYRNEGTADRINREGLLINGPEGESRIHLSALTHTRGMGIQDLIVIAVKAYDVEGVLPLLAPILGTQTKVMTVQNGLGGGERIAEVVPAEQVVVGIAENFGASRPKPWTVHHNHMGLIRLGCFDGGVGLTLEPLAQVWAGAGFPVRIFDRIDRLLWEKLVCNTAFSGSCTLTQNTIGALMNDDEHWQRALACARETYAVGVALGVAFSYDDPVDYVTRFGANIPLARPSMLQDYLAGRRTEVDAIHGSVVTVAAKLGIDAPHNRRVAEAVRKLECRQGLFP